MVGCCRWTTASWPPISCQHRGKPLQQLFLCSWLVKSWGLIHSFYWITSCLTGFLIFTLCPSLSTGCTPLVCWRMHTVRRVGYSAHYSKAACAVIHTDSSALLKWWVGLLWPLSWLKKDYICLVNKYNLFYYYYYLFICCVTDHYFLGGWKPLRHYQFCDI